MTTDQVVTDVPQSGVIVARSTRSLTPTRCEVGALDPTSDPRWDELVSSHPDFTAFHSSAWMQVLSKTYGHKARVLCWYRNGELAAALPLLEVASPLTGSRGVSLPFTDFCKPLFFTECDPSMVFEDVRTFAQRRGWKHFEIRGRLTTTLPPRSSLSFHGHSLDLRGGAEAAFANFASSVKRAIRKAEQSSLSVRLSDSEAAMRDFYRLHVRTRRRHGLPPQPFSFFSNISSEVIKPGLGFVVLAKNASKVVAGAVFFYTATTAVLKFAASDERCSHLRPNNLVMWQAIQELARRDIGTLHLGRTSRGDEGLRRFKLGWGAVEEPINYFRFNVRSNRWTTTTDKASGTHNAIFSRLPLAINRLIGAVIYPHLD